MHHILYDWVAWTSDSLPVQGPSCFDGDIISPGAYALRMHDADGKVRKRRTTQNEPGHAHELTFSCYRRLGMLDNDRTRMWFLQALDDARRRWSLDLWAFVIMPEHAHVLLLPRRSEYEVATILRAIKQPVARKAMAYLI